MILKLKIIGLVSQFETKLTGSKDL